MNKIRVLFYKTKIDGKFLDNGISDWTWLLAFVRGDWKALKYDYSHMEIWLEEQEGYGFASVEFNDTGTAPETIHYLGQCFSSTTRGSANGVRFAPASEVLKHPERWDYIEIDLDEVYGYMFNAEGDEFADIRACYGNKRIADAMSWAKKQLGKPYDYKGILGFFWPKPIHHPDKWYCSEICMQFLKIAWITDKRYKRISPRRSARVLAAKFGEPRGLFK